MKSATQIDIGVTAADQIVITTTYDDTTTAQQVMALDFTEKYIHRLQEALTLIRQHVEMRAKPESPQPDKTRISEQIGMKIH